MQEQTEGGSLTLEAMLSEKLKLDTAHCDKRAGLLFDSRFHSVGAQHGQRDDGYSPAHDLWWFAVEAACRLTLPARVSKSLD